MFTPTDEQQLVLQHDLSRHARLLAGPGTGKSATMVALLTRLLDAESPPTVKLLTFTRAATGELAAKVLEHPALAALRPSTVHSFSIAALLRNPDVSVLPMPLRIADDWENHHIVWPTLGRRLHISKSNVQRLFRELAAGWESLAPAEDERVDPEERARFMGAWDEHRQVLGYTLLSELPYALRSVLTEHEDIDGVDYSLLIVDEYQDLNACDLDLLRLLARRGARLVAAGDDDQSIYSMRKAAPEGIRRFTSEYAPADDYSLSVAQRFGATILGWASHVIEGDPDRPDRPRLQPAEGNVAGTVALLAFENERAEATGVARIVEALVMEEGIAPGEILILLRGDHNTNFSRPIRAALDRVGVEYTNPEAVKELLAEKSNRRTGEWFRLLVNRTDSLAWASVLKLERGVGDAFFDFVYDRARQRRQTFGDTLISLHETGFAEAPAQAASRASDVISRVLEWIACHEVPNEPPEDGWGSWMVDIAALTPELGPTAEYRQILLDVDAVVEGEHTLDRYLGQVPPLAKDLALAKSAGARIMTMGGAKGLTVRATVICGVENGIIPRPDTDLAEERRLLYVGMTRSREFLFCTWARRRRGPTARSGQPRVGDRRSVSSFLRGGPVSSEDGREFMRDRWAR